MIRINAELPLLLQLLSAMLTRFEETKGRISHSVVVIAEDKVACLCKQDAKNTCVSQTNKEEEEINKSKTESSSKRMCPSNNEQAPI